MKTQVAATNFVAKSRLTDTSFKYRTKQGLCVSGPSITRNSEHIDTFIKPSSEHKKLPPSTSTQNKRDRSLSPSSSENSTPSSNQPKKLKADISDITTLMKKLQPLSAMLHT